MDKLDAELIKRIEKALNLEFKEWQINYLLDIPMVLDMRITGRATGKTLVYIIKLLFAEDKPINLYDENQIWNHSDWFSLTDSPDRFRHISYIEWFGARVYSIYNYLTIAGIQTRPIVFTKKEDAKW